VVAVHQHLGLDDRYQAGLLRQRGVAGQGVGIGRHAARARNAFTDAVDAAPLGEAGTQVGVLLQARAQAVQALGHGLTGMSGQRLGAHVDLDAGDHAGLHQLLDQRRAVGGLLANGLVVEDHAGDVLAGLGGGEQHVAVVAPVLFGRRDLDAVEALLDGGGAFVGGKNSLAVGDQCLRGIRKSRCSHLTASNRMPSLVQGFI